MGLDAEGTPQLTLPVQGDPETDPRQLVCPWRLLMPMWEGRSPTRPLSRLHESLRGHVEMGGRSSHVRRGSVPRYDGMVTGEKEVLFHGCNDATIPLILKNGFDLGYCISGAFGKGNYFSPQACKAFSYSYDKTTGKVGRHILVCEVALGAVQKRLILTTPDTSLDRQKVFFAGGHRSAAHHVDGGCYLHEERIIYWNTQCKPVYVVKMRGESPAHGVQSMSADDQHRGLLKTRHPGARIWHPR